MNRERFLPQSPPFSSHDLKTSVLFLKTTDANDTGNLERSKIWREKRSQSRLWDLPEPNWSWSRVGTFGRCHIHIYIVYFYTTYISGLLPSGVGDYTVHINQNNSMIYLVLWHWSLYDPRKQKPHEQQKQPAVSGVIFHDPLLFGLA